MIAEKMKSMVANSSAIRAMFEEGNRLAQIYGRENVFDFSLGNPNVPAPKEVKEAILKILDTEGLSTVPLATPQKAHIVPIQPIVSRPFITIVRSHNAAIN